MNKLELEFRRYIITALAPVWYATIHVESHLSPGVPDMSYVIKGGKHETGWLELKAVDDPKDIFVERSQCVWMKDHAGLVPAHFLVKCRDRVHLIGGQHFGKLTKCTEETLENCSIISFPFKQLIEQLVPALHQLTLRR